MANIKNKDRGFIFDRSATSGATVVKVIPTQTVKGKKTFGSYNFPLRGGK